MLANYTGHIVSLITGSSDSFDDQGAVFNDFLSENDHCIAPTCKLVKISLGQLVKFFRYCAVKLYINSCSAYIQ